MPKDHDGNDQEQPDKKIEDDHVKTSEQDGFSRKVDFCQHGFGGVEGADRALDGIDENLPQECAHHGEGGIGNTCAADRDDALGIQENKGHRGDKRRQERPDVAKKGLPVLRAEVADEEPPGKFASGPDVAGERADELGRMAEERLGRIDADWKLRGGHGFIEA